MEIYFIHRIALAIICILTAVLILNLPFLKQAFHMDDAIYLLIAKQVFKNPWFPQDVNVLFEGIVAPDLASQEHPPLTAYFMALVALLAGDFSETNLHAAFLIFPLMIGVSMYFLSAKFTRHPLLTTLLFLAMPVVYVMSHNLMTDVPFLAFWLLSVTAFIYGIDNKNQPWLWISGVAGGLSALISYTGLCLIPLLLAYAAIRRALRASLPAVGLPIIIVGAWLTINYIHYHRFIWRWLLGYYLGKGQVLSPKLLGLKLGYIMAALGAVTVFPLPILTLAKGRVKTRLHALILLISLLFFTVIKTDYSAVHRIAFSIFLTAGLAFFVEIVAGLIDQPGLIVARRSEDELFLAIWFLGILIYATLVYLTGSARYILPLTPPLAIFFVRKAEARLKERAFKAFMSSTLALTGALAIILAVADYEFASVYRNFASEFQKKYEPPSGKVWFTGEWGLRAYMEALGGEELGRYDARPRRGDLLIVPTLATPYQTLFSSAKQKTALLMIAPSQVRFELPPLPEHARLVFTLAMPHWELSDGMGLAIYFHDGDIKEKIFSLDLTPEMGRSWHSHTVPLERFRGKKGAMIFAATVGARGDATADWVGLASARIINAKGSETIDVYDFLSNFGEARVIAQPGLDYHTEGNKPVFIYNFSLDEDRFMVLLESRTYDPRLPIRLLDSNTHAGFWSAGWGLLPFSITFSRRPIESISVFRIINEMEGKGPAPLFWFEK